jgi:hypothetical protein
MPPQPHILAPRQIGLADVSHRGLDLDTLIIGFLEGLSLRKFCILVGTCLTGIGSLGTRRLLVRLHQALVGQYIAFDITEGFRAELAVQEITQVFLRCNFVESSRWREDLPSHRQLCGLTHRWVHDLVVVCELCTADLAARSYPSLSLHLSPLGLAESQPQLERDQILVFGVVFHSHRDMRKGLLRRI